MKRIKMFETKSNATMSEKVEALMERTKEVYAKMLTGYLSCSFEDMSSEDIEMLQECAKIMHESMDLTVEFLKTSEENSRRLEKLEEIERITKENNRYLEDLIRKQDEREA